MSKTALVTGGARRLGRAISLRLAQAGYGVGVHYNLSDQQAQALVDELVASGARAWALREDLSLSGAPERLADQAWSRLGSVDLLVNNASVYEPNPAGSLSELQWDRIMTINARAPYMLAENLGLRMKQRGAGVVISLLDAASGVARREYAVYQASKAALAALTRSLARNLAPEVRVNGVAPGVVLLPEGSEPELSELLLRRIPQGRFGRPEEIAEAVLLLAEGPAFITGTILPVDGGGSLL